MRNELQQVTRAGEDATVPVPDEESRIRQSWDANAQGWTRAVREGRIESRRTTTDAAILSAVLDQRPARVLDVGCGEGWLARALAERGVAVTGFDGSADLVARAREAGGGTFERVTYDEFAAGPTRWGADFDVVVSSFSLLGREVRPLLVACRSALADGGRLLIQTVHPFTATGEGAYEDGWREESFPGLDGFRASMPWYFRTAGSWVRELAEAGLALRELREPLHPEIGRPASLILIAAAGDGISGADPA